MVGKCQLFEVLTLIYSAYFNVSVLDEYLGVLIWRQMKNNSICCLDLSKLFKDVKMNTFFANYCSFLILYLFSLFELSSLNQQFQGGVQDL